VGFSAPIFSVAIAEIYNSQLHNGIEQKPVACSTAARPADANSVTTAVAHFRLKITSMRQQSFLYAAILYAAILYAATIVPVRS
jgi:hypothetical protein